MKKRMFFLSFFGLIFAANLLFGQNDSSKTGNLIHFSFDDNTINANDTLGYWEDIHQDPLTYWNTKYSDILNVSDQRYFIKFKEYYSMDFTYIYFVENFNQDFKYEVGRFTEDWKLRYYKHKTVENGIFFFNTMYPSRTLFLDLNGTLLEYQQAKNDYLANVAGKQNNLYLCRFSSNDKVLYKYGFVDLAHYPDMDTTGTNWLYYPNSNLHEFTPIDSNLFLIFNENHDASLAEIKNDSIKTIKELTNPSHPAIFKDPFWYTKWESKDKYTVEKYQYNSLDSTFVYIEDVITDVDYVDPNYDYATYIQNDSLYVFNILNKETLKRWDVVSFSNPRLPLISYPDIYFHQTLFISDIEDNEEIPQTFEIKAYPNPFNGQVTFRVPLNVQLKRIAIFNTLGQRVYEKIFTNNDRETQIRWNAENFSSGVYLSVVETEAGSRTTKLVLLK